MTYLLKIVYNGARLSSYTKYVQNFRTITNLVYSDEVMQAKSQGKPIVALESTIITHGMPYPQNLETAIEVENIIRQRGATPATVAILKGQLTVGLDKDQIGYLAQADNVVKASRRDLASIVASGLDGATTVAGTLIATELADIPVFVTGGIGGVHRNGAQTMDISADLNELGRSKTLVVCSGVKSILDIGRTLEYLETQGVCVCSFGESFDFPAFYTPRSGHRASYRAPDAVHAAKMLQASRRLKLQSGIVIAVPIPEEHAMDVAVIQNAIDQAFIEADRVGIHGKEITPFILSAVSKATGGNSLNANIALIKNNAKIGADIAIQFSKLKNVDNLKDASNIGSSGSGVNYSQNCSRKFHTSCATTRYEKDGVPILISPDKSKGDILVIGGANVDRTYRVTENKIQLDGSTHSCASEMCGGGVGRNMAEALWRLCAGGERNLRVRLLTALGDDADGHYLRNIAPGLILDDCVVKNGHTPSYAAVLDSQGECQLGLGNMELHNHITTDLVNKHIKWLETASLVILDGNPPQQTIDYVLKLCHEMQTPVFFEPTDRRKAVKSLNNNQFYPNYASPNVAELRAMAIHLQPDLKNTLDTPILELCKIVARHIQLLLITTGKGGVIVAKQNNESKHIQARLYPVKNVIETVESVSGAGDCFASGFIYGSLRGFEESVCVHIGFQAAREALMTKNTVPNPLIIKKFNRINKNTII